MNRMTLDSDTLGRFGAFHAALEAMTSTGLWKDDELRVGVALGFGPTGTHVHEKSLPDTERFRSLMLDFRQLIGNDDLANLHRVCNLAFAHRERDGWNGDDLATIAAARSRFDAALDQPADMYTEADGMPRPSVRLLLEDWISGDWFHRDPRRQQRRRGYELSADDNLSLLLIVPAVREALKAAIEINVILIRRFGLGLVDR